MNGYLTAMKSYATFRGRASRAEFWGFTVAMSVIVFVALVIDSAFVSGPNSKELPFAGLVALAHVLPSIAVAVRRLHDVDRSGWFLLINIVPLVGFVLLLVWACEAGTRGANQYGPSPIADLGRLMDEPRPAARPPGRQLHPPAAMSSGSSNASPPCTARAACRMPSSPASRLAR